MRKNQMEIRIKDLDKYYGRKHALKHLTLTILPECLASWEETEPERRR